MKKYIFISAIAVLVIASCTKDTISPTSSNNTELNSVQYEYLATTPEIGSLGRVLFYDKSLSKSGTISCGSCHQQGKAFADDKPFSIGFEGVPTVRNSPPLQNLTSAFSPNIFTGEVVGQSLFWDGRTRDLRDMVFEPVTNHIEMGLGSPNELLDKIEGRGYYRDLFTAAFGSDEVTIGKVSDALGGFVASITSHSSPFEEALQTFMPLESVLSADVIEGFQLFTNKYQCMSCHDVVSTFGYSESFGEEFVNIGLDENYADPGRSSVTGNSSDEGKFKIPNLRNIALTGPYMHDGRFGTLEEVIDHYSHNVVSHPNLDDRLRDLTGEAMVQNITESEKQFLIAFLESLTDPVLISNPAFSDPFSE